MSLFVSVSQCVGGRVVGVNVVNVFKLDTVINLELVDKFCYLGDMVGKGGGTEEASRTSVRCASHLCKFIKHATILSMKG